MNKLGNGGWPKTLPFFSTVSALCLVVLASGCSMQNTGLREYSPDSTLSIRVLEAEDQAPVEVGLPDPVVSDAGDELSDRDLPRKYFASLAAHDGPTTALVSNDDGSLAYSAGQDGSVFMNRVVKFDPSSIASKHGYASGKLIESTKPALAIALSPDRKKLALAYFSCVIVVNLETRRIIQQLTRIKGNILALGWDPRGELLAVGRANGDIYLWNLIEGPDAGRDSARALELYQAAVSPIVDLVFHPSGRALFVAERNGAINVWRILRTERELGLRDEDNFFDRLSEGKKYVRVGNLGEQLQGIWLSSDGAELLATSGDGVVKRWRVRGLKEQEAVTVGDDSASAAQGVDIQDVKMDRIIPLFATGGRGQRLKFWCRTNAVPRKQIQSDVVVIKPVGEGAEAPPPAAAGDPADSSVKKAMVARSVVLAQPLDRISSGAGQGIIWAAQRSGNLVAFDPGVLSSTGPLHRPLKQCLEM